VPSKTGPRTARAGRHAIAAGRLHASAAALALHLLTFPFGIGAAEAATRGRAEQATPQTRADEARSERARAAQRAPARQARPVPLRASPATPVLPNAAPDVLDAIWTAAGGREADGVLLLALAWRESRFDPAADNPVSSARGLMQFTDSTWLETIRDHGRAFGLDASAAAIVTDRATGRVSVPDPRLRAEILALRDDPRLSASLAMTRIAAARPRLTGVLQRPVRTADVYLVHFLGQAGAERFLRQLARTPSERATSHVAPQAVAANGSVFVSRTGGSRSLQEVYAQIQRSLDPRGGVHTAMLARMRRGDLIEIASTE